jgi:hypothetical protein
MYAQPFDNTLICQSFKSCKLILNGTFVFPFLKMMACLSFEIVVILQHFGKEIIAKELQLNEDHEDVHRVYLAIYKSFVEVRIQTCNQPLKLR